MMDYGWHERLGVLDGVIKRSGRHELVDRVIDG